MESLRLVTYNCRERPVFVTNYTHVLPYSCYLMMLRIILYAYKRPGTLNRILPVLIHFIRIFMVLEWLQLITEIGYSMVTPLGVCPYCDERSTIGSLLLQSALVIMRWYHDIELRCNRAALYQCVVVPEGTIIKEHVTLGIQ